MAHLELQLACAVQTLDDGALLADVLLFPEVLCLDARLPRLRGTLKESAAKVLEREQAGTLYRRVLPETPRVQEVTVTLDPPKRSPAWSEPVELRFHTVRWRHGDEAHVAYVPALGIEVVAAREDELVKLIPEHIRFALRRTKVASSLYRLALSQRTEDVRIEPMELAATVKDPKQLAREDKDEEPQKPVIEEVGLDLTKQPLAPAYEVQEAVVRLADALTGRNAGSVLLVGPAGVGKTAAVHELVRRRAEFQLGSTPFWSTSGSRLVAGMSGFGMWQQRCQRLVREASKARAVVHLGNLVELMEVGRGGAARRGRAGHRRLPPAGSRARGVAGDRGVYAGAIARHRAAGPAFVAGISPGEGRGAAAGGRAGDSARRGAGRGRREGVARDRRRARRARRARPAAPPLRDLLRLPRPAAAVLAEPAARPG